MLKEEEKNIRESFSEVNIIHLMSYGIHLIVFFDTDENLKLLKSKGTTEALKKTIFKLIKKYDEFDYCHYDSFPIHFDSKQNLDENYSGNWRAYFA